MGRGSGDARALCEALDLGRVELLLLLELVQRALGRCGEELAQLRLGEERLAPVHVHAGEHLRPVWLSVGMGRERKTANEFAQADLRVDELERAVAAKLAALGAGDCRRRAGQRPKSRTQEQEGLTE